MVINETRLSIQRVYPIYQVGCSTPDRGVPFAATTGLVVPVKEKQAGGRYSLEVPSDNRCVKDGDPTSHLTALRRKRQVALERARDDRERQRLGLRRAARGPARGPDGRQEG